MKSERTCRVCGCTEVNACLTADGPCWWLAHPNSDLCSACAGAADHVVSMTIDGMTAPAMNLGTCPCGWVHREQRFARGSHLRMDQAIVAHWQEAAGR